MGGHRQAGIVLRLNSSGNVFIRVYIESSPAYGIDLGPSGLGDGRRNTVIGILFDGLASNRDPLHELDIFGTEVLAVNDLLVHGSHKQTMSSAPPLAPGQDLGMLRWEPGTTPGTLKLVAYAGTSTDGVILADNVGAGNGSV